VLLLKWYRDPIQIDTFTEIANYVFLSVFAAEAFVKIMAIGPALYFNDGWNVFDFFIVAGSLAGVLIAKQSAVQIKGATSILRAFRLMRILRLVKRGGKSLILIFNTFVITMKSLSNIGGLLLVFIYMYSIVGMILFGYTKRNGVMNDYINFESFPTAFLTLFIVGTADTWNYIMAAFTLHNLPQSGCSASAGY